MHPWEGPGPREGAPKAESQEVGAHTCTRERWSESGPLAGTGDPRAVFILSILRSHWLKAPETVCKGGSWEAGELGFKSGLLGTPVTP